MVAAGCIARSGGLCMGVQCNADGLTHSPTSRLSPYPLTARPPAVQTDLREQREVAAAAGQELAQREGLLFIETSTLDGSNVEEAFWRVATEVGGWVGGWVPLKHRQPASCRLVACPLTACWLMLGCLAGLSCMHAAPHSPPPSPLPPTACPPTHRSTALCGAGGWRRRGQRRRSQLPCHAASAYPSLPHSRTSRRSSSPGAAAAEKG